MVRNRSIIPYYQHHLAKKCLQYLKIRQFHTIWTGPNVLPTPDIDEFHQLKHMEDELYVRAASKGVPLDTNDENRTLPSRRGLPRGPGRGAFEKNTPMVTMYHQRAAKDKHGWTTFHVPRDVQSLAAMVQERIMPGSVVMTDEYRAYAKLGEKGYDHLSVNRSEGEYASGSDNAINTNICECRVGLLKWWLRKHRGASKWHLESYVKPFQFVHNHRHHPMGDRFLTTMNALLGSPKPTAAA